jgi:hypothetical protein
LGIDIVPAAGVGAGPEGAEALGVGATAEARAGLVFDVWGVLAAVGADAVSDAALPGEDAAPAIPSRRSLVQPGDAMRIPARRRTFGTMASGPATTPA